MAKTKVIGVIPARYASTRLPAKPLYKIAGKPLLEWVVKGVQKSKALDAVVVATDHPEIMQLAKLLGVDAVMTDPDLPSGSDRVWAAAQNYSDADIVLNIQGDEPLINEKWIDGVVDAMMQNVDLKMATLAHDLPLDELHEMGSVKVLLNQKSEAIYFSRLPIPYTRSTWDKYPGLCLKHIGLYGYRREFLKSFCEQKPTGIERAESLEQLRALWLGAKIHVSKISQVAIGVDTIEDAKRVEKLLLEMK
jgi:3-deoxy-manno-octulosonate cytidylyltransferase (CMP-KDO synthetase)